MAAAGPLHLVIALGSCEQHGPHLPLDVDTRIAVAVAEAVVDRRVDLTLGPVLAIGASGEHAGFPGTLSIGTDVLESVLIELTRSADHFASVLVINGHGGNVSTLVNASTHLADEGRTFRHVNCHISGGDPHAGWSETSILLHLAPEVVRLDLVEVGVTTPWSEIGSRVIAEGFAAVAPNGVLGDPTCATAEDGRRLFDGLVDRLSATVAGWLDHPRNNEPEEP